jgi:NAD+ diphosphatase
MKRKTLPLFAAINFDRSTEIRGLSSKVTRLRKGVQSKHILIWKGKVLFDCSNQKPEIAYITNSDQLLNKLRDVQINEGNFLGYSEKKPIFYHDISKWEDPNTDQSKLSSFNDDTRNHHPLLPKLWFFCDLRSVMNYLSEKDADLLATLKGIYEWNKTYTFCNRCGMPTTSKMSGWERECNSCDAKLFPRTDPVVIMLVCKENKTLLGRSSAWPKGMYSCLAGFMEPGESIEGAVARETYEEVQVRVQNTRYVSSQPWPFPASLMIGCVTQATSDDIVIDKRELEDARWFSKEEVRNAIIDCQNWWPAREGSIARFLINAWVNDEI